MYASSYCSILCFMRMQEEEEWKLYYSAEKLDMDEMSMKIK